MVYNFSNKKIFQGVFIDALIKIQEENDKYD